MGDISLAKLLSTIDMELQANNLNAAVSLIEDGRSQWQDNQQILQRLAVCHFRRGEKGLAIQTQRELVTRFPENMAAANLLITWSMQAGEVENIRPLLDVWRTRIPDHPQFWLNEIRFLHLTGQPESTLAELRRFVQAHPDSDEAWRRLMGCERNSGDEDSLAAAIKGALRALPNSLAVARVALQVSLAARNIRLAKLAYENLLRIDPEFNSREPDLSLRFELDCITHRYQNLEKDVAIEEIRALIKRIPGEVAPVRYYCRWLSGGARFAEAFPLIEEWCRRLPDDAEFLLWEIRLLRERGDIAAAWMRSEELVNKQPLLEGVWLERLLLARDESLSHLWHRTTIQAHATCPFAPQIVAVIDKGDVERGDLSFKQDTLQEFMGSCPDSLKHDRYHLAACFYIFRGQYSLALSEINEGLSELSGDYRLLLLRLTGYREFGVGPAIFTAWAQDILKHPKINLAGCIRAAEILLDAKRNELLGYLLQEIIRNPLLDSGAKLAAKNFYTVHLWSEENKVVGVVTESPVKLQFPPHVRHVCLVFGGLAHGSSKMFFGLMAPILNKLGLGAVYLMDRQKLLFLNGVEEFAPDYKGTLQALRELLPESVTTISCIGCSGGGYGALRYAIDMNAASALLFASPTKLGAEVYANDGRARVIAKRIDREVPQLAVNLAHELEHALHKPNVHLWYGGMMPEDREHALNLAGLPGVTLHELHDYAQHNVIHQLAATGQLEDVVRRALIGRPVEG